MIQPGRCDQKRVEARASRSPLKGVAVPSLNPAVSAHVAVAIVDDELCLVGPVIYTVWFLNSYL